MAVFRVEKTKDFTIMSNYHLRDKNLSLKAKGLLSQMLSLPEEWDYTLAGLAHINKESKDAIRTTILELEKAGYITRHQTTTEGGRFGIIMCIRLEGKRHKYCAHRRSFPSPAARVRKHSIRHTNALVGRPQSPHAASGQNLE